MQGTLAAPNCHFSLIDCLHPCVQLPGAASEESIHAPVGENYRINLGNPSPPSTCAPLLAAAVDAAGGDRLVPALAPAPGSAGGQVAVLQGVTEFDVTIGSEFVGVPKGGGGGRAGERAWQRQDSGQVLAALAVLAAQLDGVAASELC
jgi:hypothetical protein